MYYIVVPGNILNHPKTANVKKTIKILQEKMEKIQEKKDGTLHGGFASMRGGFNTSFFTTNYVNCTNKADCTHTSNVGLGCTNTGTCII